MNARLAHNIAANDSHADDVVMQCKLLANAFRLQARRMKQPILGRGASELNLIELADHVEQGTPLGMSFFEGFRDTAAQDGVTFEQAIRRFFSPHRGRLQHA